jgi:uncharacterized Zn finger protein
MGARLIRGRVYARRGQVVSIDVQKGTVLAQVQGSRPKPYTIKIGLKPLSEKDWDKVTDAMASQALFAARLLSGEMPQNIEEAFSEAKVSLFPTSPKDLMTDCSCPDWANPCKHIAAVYYLLAERFDEDPFLIFKLRGRTKEEIITILREKRSQAMPEADVTSPIEADVSQRETAVPLEKCLDTFWQAGAALDCFTVNPAPPEVENAILKRLGNAPFTVGKQNVASLLAKAYSVASTRALARAYSMDSTTELRKANGSQEQEALGPERKLMTAIFGEWVEDKELRQEIDGLSLREALLRQIETVERSMRRGGSPVFASWCRRLAMLRFGFIDGRCWPRREIAVEFGVTPRRVAQMESRLLRALRHPYRRQFLRPFIKEQTEH